MENKINIVGLGPGNIDYITNIGINIIKTCDIAIGGARQLQEISHLLKEDTYKYTLKKLLDVIDFIKENRHKKICVIVSGDTGFYSLLPFLKKYFNNDELNVIPGISSFQYLFSRIAEPWQEYELISCHGRENDYINVLKYKKGVALLTDDKNTPYVIAKNLYDNGYKDFEIIIGERLSYEDEKITRLNIKDFENLNHDFKMNIVVLRKEI